MSDVLETRGDYRLSVLPDDDPMPPEADGDETPPVLKFRYNRAGDVTIEAFNEKAKPFVALLEELYYQEAANVNAALTRLRQMHGTVHYETYGPNQATDWKYIAFDTHEQRDALNLPTWLTSAETNTAAQIIAEIQAWEEGDCWGWEIQKRRTFTKTYDDGEVEAGEEWRTGEYAYAYYSKAAAEAAGREVIAHPNYTPAEG